mmetsp:Transcript_54037/g.145747  ORF Transcript_54037/g.145747 Transcript_54037/m.145747 type:complete len:243 (+) Transcript_54037:177-905(+)
MLLPPHSGRVPLPVLCVAPHQPIRVLLEETLPVVAPPVGVRRLVMYYSEARGDAFVVPLVASPFSTLQPHLVGLAVLARPSALQARPRAAVTALRPAVLAAALVQCLLRSAAAGHRRLGLLAGLGRGAPVRVRARGLGRRPRLGLLARPRRGAPVRVCVRRLAAVLRCRRRGGLLAPGQLGRGGGLGRLRRGRGAAGLPVAAGLQHQLVEFGARLQVGPAHLLEPVDRALGVALAGARADED